METKRTTEKSGKTSGNGQETEGAENQSKHGRQHRREATLESGGSRGKHKGAHGHYVVEWVLYACAAVVGCLWM